MAHIDFETHESHLQDLVNRFRTAQPFEYLVIDNFLCEASLQKLMAAIPEPDQKKRSSDYMFAKNKFEDPTFAIGQNILMALRDELLSDRFAAMLSVIFGKTLFVDPAFVGGGIHQGGEGSFLDMHADFSRHPANRTWLRELNILLYLNPNYDESFGGHLELEHAQTHQQGRVAPLLNPHGGDADQRPHAARLQAHQFPQRPVPHLAGGLCLLHRSGLCCRALTLHAVEAERRLTDESGAGRAGAEFGQGQECGAGQQHGAARKVGHAKALSHAD